MSIYIGVNDGINSSAVLYRDGTILGAVQEERFNGIKNYIGFPSQAIAYLLNEYGIEKIDAVVIAGLKSSSIDINKFKSKYDRRYHGEKIAPKPQKRSLKDIARDAAPDALLKKYRELRGINIEDAPRIESKLKELGLGGVKIVRYEHHFCHAASVYYGCRKTFDEPHLIFTLDGDGDGCCSHVYIGTEGKLEKIAETLSGHSIGNIYSCATHYLGFTPHEHEYKLMGMAAYVDAEYAKDTTDIFESYIGLAPESPLTFKRKIHEHTGFVGPRLAQDFELIRFDNFCAGLQQMVERLLVSWVSGAVKSTSISNVLVAGGVFMNVKVNKLLSHLPEVDYFNVIPSCGDESLPFGAVWGHAALNDGVKSIEKFTSPYLGPEPASDFEETIGKYASSIRYQKVENPDAKIGSLIAEGQIVARCSGRMEFGSRALGNRSLLCDPRNYLSVIKLNKAIKKRDFWMPFAPAILREDAESLLNIPGTLPKEISPYMMLSFETQNQNSMMAATHVYDGTARAQIVNKEITPGFHKVISEFKKHTGLGCVLNTSFNLHGLPIVRNTQDALHVFVNSDLDHLFINNYYITKQ